MKTSLPKQNQQPSPPPPQPPNYDVPGIPATSSSGLPSQVVIDGKVIPVSQWVVIDEGTDAEGNRVEYSVPMLPWNTMGKNTPTDLFNNIYSKNLTTNSVIKIEPANAVKGGYDPNTVFQDAMPVMFANELTNGGSDRWLLDLPGVEDLITQQASIAPIGDESYLNMVKTTLDKVKKYPGYADRILSSLPGAPAPKAPNENIDAAQYQTLMNQIQTGAGKTPEQSKNELDWRQTNLANLEQPYQKWSGLKEAGIFNPQMPVGQEEQAAALLLNEYQGLQTRIGEINKGNTAGATLQEQQLAAPPAAFGGQVTSEREEAYQDQLRRQDNARRLKEKYEWQKMVAWTKQPARKTGI